MSMKDQETEMKFLRI